jgi:hypothetical protein
MTAPACARPVGQGKPGELNMVHAEQACAELEHSRPVETGGQKQVPSRGADES